MAAATARTGCYVLRQRDTSKPFFLFASFNAPHPPFDPPQWALEQYLDAPMPGPPVGDWVDAFSAYANPHDPTTLVGDIDPQLLRRARAGYYGHMSHVDHQVNFLLETLAQYGVRENTYVCFLSDHGEMLGDHHLFRKGYPYEGSARIPMLLTGPGIPPGVDDDHVVDLRDVMPTLLHCAGLPIPEHVEGRSFLPLARGQQVSWRDTLHGEHTLLGQSLQWLTDGRLKYIWHSGTGREQLFNLEDDPSELRDLAADTGRVRPWREALAAVLSGREEGFTDGARLIPGRPVQPTLAHLRRRLGLE